MTTVEPVPLAGGAGLDTITLTLGCLFLAGMVADIVGRATPVPRATLLLGWHKGPLVFPVLVEFP